MKECSIVLCFLLWILTIFLVPVVEGVACSLKGWFGEDCQYQCHCANVTKCDFNTGECSDNSACVKGWFGPACQYVDLTTTETTSTGWLYDGDDTTCNDGQDSVMVELGEPVPFTWLRVYLKNPEKFDNINIQFKTNSGASAMSCNNKKTSAVSERTLDIHCDLDVLVQQVILTGQGVASLCSVYISGGRNVALKQPTQQSSDYSHSNMTASSNAVDGNRDGDWLSGSCTQTGRDDSNPSWSLTFRHPQTINRYVLYNRQFFAVEIPERLLHFNLTSYSGSTQVFTYQDQKTEPQYVYTVIPNVTSTSPVSEVTIRTTYVSIAVGDTVPVLTLCEVETYGDTVCPQGRYGRECEHSCDYCKNQICFVSTGGCPDGCGDVGFIGNRCQTTCPDTYYGQDCTQRCSNNCADQLCDKVTGVCNQCPPGKNGDQCDQDCPSTYYGQDCKQRCSTNCLDQLCDNVNGACNQCPPGKNGNLCYQDCPDTLYGQECKEKCSTGCKDELCNKVNGTCHHCMSGKTGDMCTQDCPHTTYGQDCLQTCSTNCVDQDCNPVSGVCVLCPHGKMGDQCDQACPDTYYGQDCKQRCSNNCVDQLCDNVNGVCNQCLPGKNGNLCYQDCPDTLYGQDCKEKCSTGCKDEFCNKVNGTCHQCVSGKTGDICTLDCPHTTYGQDCLQTCSTNCVDQDCNPVSGVCVLCPHGKMGDQCDQDCDKDTYGRNCEETCSEHCLRPTGTILKISSCDPLNGTCVFGCVEGYVKPLCLASTQQESSTDSVFGVGVGLGVGVCVLIAVVVVGVYCYRKRLHNTRSRRQRPPGYDGTDFTMQDDHNYRELFRGNDDYNLPTDESPDDVITTNRPRDTAAYENTVVGDYEDIAGETSRGEPDGGYANDVTKTSGVEKADGGYANCADETK